MIEKSWQCSASRKDNGEIMGKTDKKEIYKTAIYLRLSKGDGDVDGIDKAESNSITNQRMIILSFLKKHEDLKLVDTYIDDGYTGTNFERPEFNRMMDDVRSGKINCICVKDLSRFGRDYLETGNYIETIFPFLGVRFISVNDHFDTEQDYNENKSLEIALKNLVNDMYAKDISKRLVVTRKHEMERGKFTGSNAPYGYKVNESDPMRRFVVDEPAAAVVRKIFSMALEGKSIRKISIYLQNKNLSIPAQYLKTGHLYQEDGDEKKVWHIGTLSNILKNQAYIGNLVQGKRKTRLCDNEKRHFTDKDEWIICENAHEAIISEEMFDTVQKKRVGNRNHCQMRESHCLKGKIICGNCGHKMNHSNAGRPKYECRQHYVNPSITGCVKSVRDADIEVIVIQELQAQLDAMLDNEKMQKRQKQLQSEKMHEAEKKLRTMQLSQEKIEADLQNAYEAYKSGLTDKETYLEQRQVYEQLEDKIRDTVQKQMKIVSEYEEKVLTMPAGFDIIESRTKVVELNREIVETFVDRIVVHEGGEIEIGWKFEYMIG